MNISDDLKDMLTEVFNIGVGRSASALSDMLNCTIEMKIPNLYFLSRESLENYFDNINEDKYICVIQRFHGGLEGLGSMAFPITRGKTLVDNMLNVTSFKPDFGSMEIEAIQEVGNIIINAIGGAFSNTFWIKMEYDVPEILFIKHPIPFEESSPKDTTFYNFATTTLKVKEVDIEGTLNMMFGYSNLEFLESFLLESYDLSIKFGEILVKENVISNEQLENALKIQKESNKFIGELMIEEGYITEEQRDIIFHSEEYKKQSKKFGELLMANNYISIEQLHDILEKQRRARSFIGEILIELGFLDPLTRDVAISKQSFARKF